jgi:AbrB family looped-hinge helix DNA binding protein
MKITSKGQVTIPANIRAQAGLLPNTFVEFVLCGGEWYSRKPSVKAGVDRNWLMRCAARARCA